MAKKEAKANNKENKNKKSFFKSFKAELKKVSWPTPKQLVNNTVAVITIVLITALIVFVLDLAFETINRNGVDKIKEVIETTQEDSSDTSEEANSQEDNTTQNTENTDETEENANNEENTNSDNTNTQNTDSTETNTNNSENNIQE